MTPSSLQYTHSERLRPGAPVDRLDYIERQCADRVVLDIGGLDETALAKRNTGFWLHERISSGARAVVGIDNSDAIPEGGLHTGPTSLILRGDATRILMSNLPRSDFDVVVAGEFIEHLECPLQFLVGLREALPGRDLIISTPNGVSAALLAMAVLGREVQHPDHLHVYTYKTLHTLFKRAGFQEWQIIPYRFSAAELYLRTRGWRRVATRVGAEGLRLVERVFPLLSHGYLVHAVL